MDIYLHLNKAIHDRSISYIFLSIALVYHETRDTIHSIVVFGFDNIQPLTTILLKTKN